MFTVVKTTKIELSGPIVMVDDEHDLVRSMVEMLRKEFAPTPVIGTSDPREAVKILDKERPSVLITDIRMPHMTGLELISHAQKRWSSIPIIAITAFPSPEVAAHSRFSGFAYLQKPVAFRTLREVIANLSEVPVAAFRGAVATTSLADVIQLYALSSQTGVILIECDQMVGEIWIDQGRAVHAATGDRRGPSAFYQIMSWPRGSFRWQTGRPKQTTIEGSLTELLLESYRLKDEQAQGLNAAAENSASKGSAPAPKTPELAPGAAPRPAQATAVAAAASPDAVSDAPYLDDIDIIWTEQDTAGPKVTGTHKEIDMALTSNSIKETLMKLESIEGFIGAALADSDSGMCMGSMGGAGIINMELAAASNAEVVRSKRKAIKALSLRDDIEDVLLSLNKQYHIIRPLKSRPSVFFYIALDRNRANLAMARFALADAERELTL